MISSRQASALQAAGRIEAVRQDISGMQKALQSLASWRPAAGLQRQCKDALSIIDDLARRLDRKLVVTFIGPCGAGKSTLLNALAGVDDLSETGTRRPTTRQLVVFGRDRQDAAQLRQRLGEGAVTWRTSSAAEALAHVMLIDTPDTDSSEQSRHLPLLKRAIGLSDVLVCVFNAENPKTRDHVDVLAPLVALFDGQSLLTVLNRCDRLAEDELKDVILPEFSAYLAAAWQPRVARVLCTSGRRNLHRPHWEPQAAPRHAFDQFSDLRELIFGEFNRPGFAVDRRVENAAGIRDFVFFEIRREAGAAAPAAAAAKTEIDTIHREALDAALEALKSSQAGLAGGINLLFYQQLAQRWSGPVGWLTAVWSRLLTFGSGLFSLLRFGNPLRQAFGLAGVVRHAGKSRADRKSARSGTAVGTAFQAYRQVLLLRWPDVAETLIAAGFNPAVRSLAGLLKPDDAFQDELAALWERSLEQGIARTARRLSRGWLQVILNVPALAILAHAGWITLREYFQGNYQNSGFFLHALIAVGVVLLLSFFLLQAGIRVAGSPERIAAEAFEAARRGLSEATPQAMDPLSEQIAVLLERIVPQIGAKHGPEE